jgi:MFS family permease
MNIQGATANKIIAWALLFGTPFFIVFGILSDRIGRKKLMMSACLLAVIGYIPIYTAMQKTIPHIDTLGTPAVAVESTVDPVTKKQAVTKSETWQQGELKVVKKTLVNSEADLTPVEKEKPKTEIQPPVATYWKLVGLIFIQVLLVTMVYGPIAAFLVELFPTRIRYTSMSLPYHIGNGVFGGLVPFIGTAMVARTGNNLAGLWYPMAIAAMTFLIGSFMIHEHRTADGFSEDTE